jgi:hypothetical protein
LHSKQGKRIFLNQFVTEDGAKFFFVAAFSLKEERKLWVSLPDPPKVLKTTGVNEPCLILTIR